MTDVFSILFLLSLAAGVWWLISSQQALELARDAGRHSCAAAQLQFLDDTVVSTRVRLSRDDEGRRVILRYYRFEFSETGNSRLEGEIVLQGNQIQSITLEPYRLRDISDEVEVVNPADAQQHNLLK